MLPDLPGPLLSTISRGLDAGTTWAPTLPSEIIPPQPSTL